MQEQWLIIISEIYSYQTEPPRYLGVAGKLITIKSFPSAVRNLVCTDPIVRMPKTPKPPSSKAARVAAEPFPLRPKAQSSEKKPPKQSSTPIAYGGENSGWDTSVSHSLNDRLCGPFPRQLVCYPVIEHCLYAINQLLVGPFSAYTLSYTNMRKFVDLFHHCAICHFVKSRRL